MRISHRYKFVFLAFPRTASTSVRRLLDPFSDVASVHKAQTTPDFPFYHHITADELKTIFDQRGWDWFAYQRFCVVRNPYDRAVSLFRHRTEKDAAGHARPNLFSSMMNVLYKKTPRRLAFPLFVCAIRSDAGVSKSLRAFICDRQGHPLVDDVLQFECLSEDLPGYLQTLGIEVQGEQLLRLNVSRDRAAYAGWYTPFTRKLIERKYNYELERFGYRFG